MADERDSAVRNRRFDSKSVGRRWMLFVGDCAQVGDALASKPVTPGWVALGFLESVLRTYGQVLFCNNPVTGLVILTSLLVIDSYAALASLVCASVAIVTAWLIDQPPELVRAGIFSFNSLLVGSVSMALLPIVKGDGVVKGDIVGIDYLFMIVAAIMGVYLTSAYFTLFGHISKHPMPGFTVPFVTVQALVFICSSAPALNPSSLPSSTVADPVRLARAADPLGTLALDFAGMPLAPLGSPDDPIQAIADDVMFADSPGVEALVNETRNEPSAEDAHWRNESVTTVTEANAGAVRSPKPTGAPAIAFDSLVNGSRSASTHTSLDWGQVFTGVLLSMGQVFAQNSLPASLFMYLAVIVSSPTTALMCLFGSTIGTLVGAMFAVDAAALIPVYEGHWGFNALLTAASMGGFTLVVTPQSVGLTLMATLFCGLIQVAIMPKMTIPIMSIPFNVAALIMLCTTAAGDSSIVRPAALTYPEKHRRDWTRLRRAKKNEKLRSISETLPENGTDAEQTRKLEMV